MVAEKTFFPSPFSYLIVGLDLPDENGKVLDSQHGIVVHLLVGPLHRGLGISGEKKIYTMMSVKSQSMLKSGLDIVQSRAAACHPIVYSAK